MDNTRRSQIRKIIDHFRGGAVTQNVIEEFCKLNKLEPIAVGDFQDYLVQVEHDEKVGRIYADIMKELQNLRFVPEFSSAKERTDALQANEEVEIQIAKLFEREGIRYNFVSGASEEIARAVHHAVQSGGNRIFNKATSVLLEIAKEKFGGEFNTKHSADYWEERYKKVEGK